MIDSTAARPGAFTPIWLFAALVLVAGVRFDPAASVGTWTREEPQLPEGGHSSRLAGCGDKFRRAYRRVWQGWFAIGSTSHAHRDRPRRFRQDSPGPGSRPRLYGGRFDVGVTLVELAPLEDPDMVASTAARAPGAEDADRSDNAVADEDVTAALPRPSEVTCLSR